MLQLFDYLMNILELEEVKLFLVQAWMLWNQRNSVMHGGKLKDLGWLNTYAEEWLEESAQAQQLSVTPRGTEGYVWRPPSHPFFKLNFDAAIIKERCMPGFGAMIRNEQGEVMVAFFAIRPSVSCNEEAETLACRKAVEFAVDTGFSELIIERDSINVMQAVSSSILDLLVVGNVVADIQWLIHGLRRVSINLVKRDCNRAAHVLARYARNLDEDMYWMEDAPPVALGAMYQDLVLMNTLVADPRVARGNFYGKMKCFAKIFLILLVRCSCYPPVISNDLLLLKLHYICINNIL